MENKRKRNTGWICRRVSKGKACGTTNLPRSRVCKRCGKNRPPKRIPAHRAVLRELSYEDYIRINGGEFCWIHKALNRPEPKRTRRLHRDHDHTTGRPRGLLCAQCNRAIKNWMDAEWMDATAMYLRKFSKE